MKRHIIQGGSLWGTLLAGVLAISSTAAIAQADQNGTNDQVEVRVSTPQGTPSTVSGRSSGLNFATRSFWVDVDGRTIAVHADKANIKYQDQDANLYRLMGSPQVTVSGTMFPATSFAPGGILHADAVTITSGPTVRLQRSSYTDQAQPAFGANDLVPLTVGGTTATSLPDYPPAKISASTGSYQAASSQGYVTTGASRQYGKVVKHAQHTTSTHHRRHHRRHH